MQKWSKRQTKGIKKSIKHWQDIVSGKWEADTGPKDCALCLLYFNTDCTACPVAITTFDVQCNNTPYYQSRIYPERDKKMLKLLEGLLPSTTKEKLSGQRKGR